MNQSSVNRLMKAESSVINKYFQRNRIRAKVNPSTSLNIAVGYLRYGLHLASDERFSRVEGVQRELSSHLTQFRNSNGIRGTVDALPTIAPLPALELPHPRPEVLQSEPEHLGGVGPHTMVLGKSYYHGSQVETLTFSESPHVLIAGMTNSGKSVLLQHMIFSLCFNTSPDDVQLLLVDLKNEDLIPLKSLPHTKAFAGTRGKAFELIEWLVAEKGRRIENHVNTPRIVLVIDEIVQLANDPGVADMLGDLSTIGRSKGINLICATQSPTSKGGIGSLMKANFNCRLVGQVAPGTSQYATNRAGTHAELLPGKGSFLRCQGRDVYRFQSFYLSDADIAHIVTYLGGRTTPVRHFDRYNEKAALPLEGRTVERKNRTKVEPAVEQLVEPDEIDTIANAIVESGMQSASKNAISMELFGRKFGGSHGRKINDALDRLSANTSEDAQVDDTKIIRLRRNAA